MELRIEPADTRFVPGDAVRGRVVVTAGGEARAITVRLVYREASPDYTADNLEAGEAVVHTGGFVAPDTAFDFTFELPDYARPNFQAKHSMLAWVLEAKADIAGGKDVTERKKIDVRMTWPMTAADRKAASA